MLREYAFVADGERGALIGPRGDFAWMCAPSWDSDAVFSTLIGGNGVYSICPTGRFVWGGYYEDGSLIWRSRWVVGNSIIECREALAYPADPHRAVIMRQIVAINGDAELEVYLQPQAGFGKHRLKNIHRDDDGVWTARTGDLRIRWTGAPDAKPADHDGRLVTLVKVGAGTSHDLVLECGDVELPRTPPDPAKLWSQTERAWEEAIPTFGPSLAHRDSAHSYAVMQGMTSQGGGMVAAATMSLPERADEGANYDYRYVWIRDQCYAGQAVAADGSHPLLENAVKFVAERLLDDGPKLMPGYTVRGGAIPGQRELNLPGYPGGYDILGNHVCDQFQLDAFGEALLLFAAAARRDCFDDAYHAAVPIAVSAIEDNYQRADAGIWELEDKHYAHSRLICAAGLRAIARDGGNMAEVAHLTSLADRITADAASDCLHPTGRWQRAPDDPRVDAALLMPALRGGIPASDPRSLATYRAVHTDLSRDYCVYRFAPEAGLGSTDSAFLLCGFAMSMSAQQMGETVEAMRYFERTRAACGPPGLLSEEFDITQRQLRGNIPQAFVHSAMFEASCRLAQAVDQGPPAIQPGALPG